MKTILLVCFLYSTTLSFSKEDKDIIIQIDSINTEALRFYNNNEIVNALQFINQSKKVSESSNNVYGYALANFTQGQIYNDIGEYDAAESRFVASLKSSLEIEDNYLTANSYLNLGRLSKKNKSFKQSRSYFQNALKHATIGGENRSANHDKLERLLFEIHIDLCQLYFDNNLIDRGFKYLLTAKHHLNNFEIDSRANATLKYTEGLFFIKKELFNNASKKFNEAFGFLESNNKVDSQVNLLLVNIHEKLAYSLYKQDLDKQAYAAQLKYDIYKDALASKALINRKSVAEAKFLIEDYKKEAQIANTERIHQLEITNKAKTLNIIISIALFLFLVSLIILYRNYIAKQKLANILKIQNKELELARNEAVKSSELKSKFISNVTHELRTPLYGVVGITSLLLEKNDLSKSDVKFINSLKYSGDYLLNLVNDILQVSKIESQKIELKYTSVNLKPLIENIVNSFDFRLKETNNKINVMLDDQLPEFIMCDKVRLSQILINLIGNSIKFTESGWINLRVIMTGLNENSVGLRFEVEDNGCGIPQHKFDTIFDNFSQLDENKNLNYQGTGLGLSITKNLIELFDSEIELKSQVDVGSMFSFNVNFEIDKKEKCDNASINEIQTKSLKNRYKILVAEDNKINQIVTQNLLKKANYQFVVVSNGLEALKEAKTNEYDLILMDINMPVMNGKEATNSIREFNTLIPIIALTASDVDSVKRDCSDIDFDDVIYKPFDNYEFYQIIETNIESSKLKLSDDNFNKAS